MNTLKGDLSRYFLDKIIIFFQSNSHQRLCDYEYVQLCRKFSTEVRLIITNKPQTKRIGNSMTEAVCGKDTSTNHDIVSQRESNNLLESFYTTEMRFRNIASAKDVAVS